MSTGTGPGGRRRPDALDRAVARLTGSTVVSRRPVGGGDINEAHRATLADGREVFVKTHPDPPPGFFTAEADGLAWLGAAGAIRVPTVVAADDGAGPERVRGDGSEERRPAVLVLEWIEPGPPGPDVDEDLGRQLAELHRSGAASFGLERDNYVGTVAQANAPAATWAEFYGSRRLEPLIRANADTGRLDPATVSLYERVATRLEQLCGPHEPPARLHGDLWSGNRMCGADGRPVLVDPAVYGGHREIDLAMMRLFGGFAPATFAAYHETHPLADGHGERVALNQLYPLLVHVTLFGGSYGRAVRDALARYA